MNIFLGLLIAYILLLLGISWWVGAQDSEEDFLIAGRDRPWWQVMFSKFAAAIGAGWIIVYTGFAYTFGVALGVVFLGIIIGSLVYAYWAVPRIFAVTEKVPCYTLGDYVYACTKDLWARKTGNLMSTLMSLVVMVVAVVGGATLMEGLGVLSYETSIALTVGVVLIYILLSGYKAVMLTDVFQGVLLVVLLLLLVAGISYQNPVDVELFFESRNISLFGIIMLSIFGTISIFADPSRYQVGYAARSVGALQKGMYWILAPFILTAVSLFFIGVTIYGIDATLEAAEVFPIAITQFIPASLVPFGFFVFFVAVMSSADSFIYVMATHTIGIFKEGIKKWETRGWVLFYGILVSVLALLFRDIVQLALLSAALAFSLALPMLYLIQGGTRGVRYTAMAVGGFLGVFVGIQLMGFVPEASVFVIMGNIIGYYVPLFFPNVEQ